MYTICTRIIALHVSIVSNDIFGVWFTTLPRRKCNKLIWIFIYYTPPKTIIVYHFKYYIIQSWSSFIHTRWFQGRLFANRYTCTRKRYCCIYTQTDNYNEYRCVTYRYIKTSLGISTTNIQTFWRPFKPTHQFFKFSPYLVLIKISKWFTVVYNN